MSKKKTTGFVAGAAGVALLMSGATFALWQDSDTVHDETITAGNLAVDVDQHAVTWTDTSSGDEITNLGAFRIVPGDTIEGRFPIDVELEGNNLDAKLSFNAGEWDGALVHGLSFDFDVLDADDDSMELHRSTADPTSLHLKLDPDRLEKESDEKPDLTAVVRMTFPQNTNDQDFAETELSLANAGVTLEQVRP